MIKKLIPPKDSHTWNCVWAFLIGGIILILIGCDSAGSTSVIALGFGAIYCLVGWLLLFLVEN